MNNIWLCKRECAGKILSLKENARKLKNDIPAVFLAMKDKETPALIALTIKLIPRSVYEKCLEEAEDMWKDNKPKKWSFVYKG